ncbi:LLM class oxidoreductase [Paenibacillus validus]|uniref:TIGR03571 family LLM class oxidoreductase n=1 Tax=Paenibacillus validus TaxID=44253 RepID=A0A7X2ZBD1_9BACL|nr:LLM class oxidoreductase [Paenibacillus validus]MUG71833.1 TIGR03571 family LLM class oxidoreductase [Paenibacillus validus]
MNSIEQNRAYKQMYAKDKLTLGFFIPIEAHKGRDIPTMENQAQLARRADELGFSALWFRDVLLHDPSFGDAGHLYDMWIYLTYIAAGTNQIALATGSVVLPLHPPARVAKMAASLDQLFQQRLILGVSSGDRMYDFPALGVSHADRSELFRESFAYLQRVISESFPIISSPLGVMQGNVNLIPKPSGRVPTFITGYSQQTIEWIAEHGDGWVYYPRNVANQARSIAEWRRCIEEKTPGVFKPFSQSLFIDLSEDPDEMPTPIHLGYRLGRNLLIELLESFREIGVNHVALILSLGIRPADDVLEELGQFVLPYFPTHTHEHMHRP